ncbi:hypothetical protein N2152v2_010054 [Parachlorella kessleri]
MGKAWQPAGYQPLPSGDDPSVNGKASDSSAKAGASFLPSFEPAALQSVDSTLRFTPNSTLGPTRKWLHIDDKGAAKLIEVDRHRLVADLNIRFRDLLTLDPTVPIPYPASLLIRERAIIVNLESIRMIVCSNQVYVLSVPKEDDPAVAAAPLPDSLFVLQLCMALQAGEAGSSSSPAAGAGGAGAQLIPGASPNPYGALDGSMPFELRALECALDWAVQLLSGEVAVLEREAYPVIDALAAQARRSFWGRVLQHVSRELLGAVRGVKGTLMRLLGRVQRIRQEIEEIMGDDNDMQARVTVRVLVLQPELERIRQKIMGDDNDMQDMYLGRRAARSGQPAPPQPPCTPTHFRHHRTVNNLAALQQEPPAGPASPSAHTPGGSPLPHLRRPASAGAGLGTLGGAGGSSSMSSMSGSVTPAAPGGGGALGAGGGSARGMGVHGSHSDAELLAQHHGVGSATGAGGSSGARGTPMHVSHSAAELVGQQRGSLLGPAAAPVEEGSEHGGGAGSAGVAASEALEGRRVRIQATEAAAAEAACAAEGESADPDEFEKGLERAGSLKGHHHHHTGGVLAKAGDGKSRAQELWARGGNKLRQAGLVVRTVRRLKTLRSQAKGDSKPAGDDASSTGEGSVVEEEFLELPGGALVDPHEVEELEDLLESYFMQVDYLLRRLMLLNERVGSTEAYLSIEMDHRRNELVALDLFATCVTGAFAFVSMIGGIFGMNLAIGDWSQAKYSFYIITGLSALGGLLLLALFLGPPRSRPPPAMSAENIQPPPPGLLDLPQTLLVHILGLLLPSDPQEDPEPQDDLANTRLACKALQKAILAVPNKPFVALKAAKLQQAKEAGLEGQMLAFLARYAGRCRDMRIDGVDGHDLQQVVRSLVPAVRSGNSNNSRASSISGCRGVHSLELRSIGPPWTVLPELAAVPSLSRLKVCSYYNQSPIAASDLALLSSLAALQSLVVQAPVAASLSLPAEVLPSLQRLTSLELCFYTPIDDYDAVEEDEQERCYLTICGEHLAGCTALRRLELCWVQLVGPGPTTWPRLEHLGLIEIRAEAGFWAALPQLPCLTSLGLEQLSEEMFEEFLSFLPACPCLGALELVGEHLRTQPQLPPSLTKLEVTGDVSLRTAPYGLSLRCLQLHCASSLEAWPESMSAMVQLTALRINGLLPELPLPLAALPALEDVHLADTHLTGLPWQLAWVGSVRRLVLARCRLKRVPAVLGGGAASRLEQLDLAANGDLVVTQEGLEVLGSLTALQILNITDIGTGSWSGDKEAAEALRRALTPGCKIVNDMYWN